MLINWRKPIINTLLTISESRILDNLAYIRKLEEKTADEIQEEQRKKLVKLLLHAHKNVPYYRKLLPQVGVINKSGEVELAYFEQIPPLTKSLIRKLGSNLYSADYLKRKHYANTSGGSTGEPVKFIQDKKYDEWNTANKLYYNWYHGKDYGEPEIKLWGSDRDILEGTLGFKENVINNLYNRKFLNTFDLSRKNFDQYLKAINKFKPKAIWAYYDSMYELAKYANKHGIQVHSPEVIFTTIGKLTDSMYDEVKTAFSNSKIIDQYGSREVGVIGFEREERGPLSLFPWSQKLEVVNELNKPVYDQEGRILVTTLENYSMPLIRYQIEDMGILAKNKNGSEVLDEVTGRIFAHFHKKDGGMVHAQFFVTLMFDKSWVKRFQFIQKTYNFIILKIESKSQEDKTDLKDIEAKVKKVMGKDCNLEIDLVDKIMPSKSGKYLYTLTEIRN